MGDFLLCMNPKCNFLADIADDGMQKYLGTCGHITCIEMIRKFSDENLLKKYVDAIYNFEHNPDNEDDFIFARDSLTDIIMQRFNDFPFKFVEQRAHFEVDDSVSAEKARRNKVKADKKRARYHTDLKFASTIRERNKKKRAEKKAKKLAKDPETMQLNLKTFVDDYIMDF